MKSLLTTKCTVGDLSTGDLFTIYHRKYRKMMTELGDYHFCHDLTNQKLVSFRLGTPVEKVNELVTEPLEVSDD